MARLSREARATAWAGTKRLQRGEARLSRAIGFATAFSMKRTILLFISVFLIFAGCSKQVEQKYKNNRYYTKAELESLMNGCNSTGDIYSVFGPPAYIDEYEDNKILWVYTTDISLDIPDGISGFSAKFSKNGHLIWWKPILTNRTKGLKSAN